MSQPCYLIIKTSVSNAKFQEFCKTNGALCSSAAAISHTHETTSLEPGSVPTNILISRFEDHINATEAWSACDKSALMTTKDTVAILSPAVPDEGFPAELDFLPTHANTTATETNSPTLMLIEGSVWDEKPINAYRDIIMPMLKERNAFYLVYTLADDIEVLHGEWNEGFLALSRWLTPAMAYDFWLSDTYQNTAIPTRIDAGKFSVLLFQGEQDQF